MNWPYVRRARLDAAEANAAALRTERDHLHAAVESLTSACALYAEGIATLQRMLAQQQMTMILNLHWRSMTPHDAQEATSVTPPQ